MPYHVYILASARNGTLYVGMTNDLVRRMREHRDGAADGFTRKYGVKMLVHAETYDDVLQARAREQSLKRWRRAWKLALIERDNSAWRDMSDDLFT